MVIPLRYPLEIYTGRYPVEALTEENLIFDRFKGRTKAEEVDEIIEND